VEGLRANPLRVLVVEDNEVNQQVAVGMLTFLGQQASVASDGLQALQQLEEQVYDIVLMDVQMPAMDGLSATRAIRKKPAPLGQIVIVGMTANVMTHDRQLCLDAGMDDYLAKPVKRHALAAMLCRWRTLLAESDASKMPVSPPLPAPLPQACVQERPPASLDAVHELLDVKLLGELVQMIGADDCLSLIEAFRSSIAQYRDGVLAAIEKQQPAEAGRLCHAARGTALNLGFKRLAGQIWVMETAIAAGADLEVPLMQLTHAFDETASIARPDALRKVLSLSST
jgi:two-component system, sensor histidine kinase